MRSQVTSAYGVGVVSKPQACSAENARFVVLGSNLKCTESSISPISIDLLLTHRSMPRTPDLVIFVVTTDRIDYHYPLHIHAGQSIAYCAYHRLNIVG